jgi:hypothetical protein
MLVPDCVAATLREAPGGEWQGWLPCLPAARLPPFCNSTEGFQVKKFDPCGKCAAFDKFCFACVIAAMHKAGLLAPPHAGARGAA